MNWGKGIIVFLIVFILIMMGMAGFLMNQPSDDFDPDYYERGIHFDQDYNREKKVFTDKVEPQFQIKKNQVLVYFHSPVKGQIQFLRPSSHALDTSIKFEFLQPDSLKIQDQNLPRGNWQIILEWASPRGTYLYQKEIFLP